MKPIMFCLAALVLPIAVSAAVPQLKGSQETAGTMGLKVKPPNGARMVQAFTPKGQNWTFRRGEEKWTEMHYDAREIWFKEFADCQGVVPAYLEAMKEGKSAREATRIAWEGVSQRDFVADFLKFWGKRTAARRYEPPEAK